jgi:hypothetical protein
MKKIPINYKKVTIDYLHERDSGICQICNNPLQDGSLCEIDHIIEKKNGGVDKLHNLRIVHLECHKKRHGVNGITLHPHVIIRKDYHRMVIENIRTALLLQPVLTKACQTIGLSERMGRYYMTKYNLNPKEAKNWDIKA